MSTPRIGPDDPRYLGVVDKRFNKRFSASPDYVRLVGSTDQVVSAVEDAVREGQRLVVTSGGHCLEASTRWYIEKLGLTVVMRVPRTDATRAKVSLLQGGGLAVELIQHDDAVSLRSILPAARDAISVHGISKVGVTVDDFDKTLNTLRARGVEIAYGPWPKRPDQPANVIIRDNAGNLIQISGK